MTARLMKERPIPFNGEMVRAILDGRKTQTRRVVKPQPRGIWGSGVALPGNSLGVRSDAFHVHANVQSESRHLYCPYGKPGDRLWVRETVADVNSEMGPTLLYRADEAMIGWEDFSEVFDKDFGAGPSFNYGVYPGMKNKWAVWHSDIDSKDDGGKWTPSIHMPRWASRINLEIKAIRVERLQEISEEDAKAEGIKPLSPISGPLYKEQFADLWESINGALSWDANPWVWVIEFEMIK